MSAQLYHNAVGSRALNEPGTWGPDPPMRMNNF